MENMDLYQRMEAFCKENDIYRQKNFLSINELSPNNPSLHDKMSVFGLYKDKWYLNRFSEIFIRPPDVTVYQLSPLAFRYLRRYPERINLNKDQFAHYFPSNVVVHADTLGLELSLSKIKREVAKLTKEPVSIVNKYYEPPLRDTIVQDSFQLQLS